MALRSQRTKLTLKDLGEPAIIKAQPEDVKKYMVGTLIGIARGFTERSSADKSEKFEGLLGSFRAIPSDPKADEIESGVLFLPEAFHNLIAAKLRAELQDGKSGQCKFAYEVSSIRAKNPAGYSWDFTPLVDQEAGNPLDEWIEAVAAVLPAPKKKLLLEDRSEASRKK